MMSQHVGVFVVKEASIAEESLYVHQTDNTHTSHISLPGIKEILPNCLHTADNRVNTDCCGEQINALEGSWKSIQLKDRLCNRICKEGQIAISIYCPVPNEHPTTTIRIKFNCPAFLLWQDGDS